MADQLIQIIQDKILASVEAGMPVLTRRDATLPPLNGKAAAVIGMRRAGKTSFIHQCRADLIAAGRAPGRLLSFNFEDERLGDMQAGQLHLIPDTHLRLFPEPADEPVTLLLDEIQRVPKWEQFVRPKPTTPTPRAHRRAAPSRCHRAPRRDQRHRASLARSPTAELTSRSFLVTKFSADLKSQGISVGREYLYEFLSHQEDAFLLQTIPVATDSEKRRQVNPRNRMESACGGQNQQSPFGFKRVEIARDQHSMGRGSVKDTQTWRVR